MARELLRYEIIIRNGGAIMSKTFQNRVVRRLTAAEGYLELGLPQNALDELDEIDDAGRLEPHRQNLLGHALKDKKEFSQAVKALLFAVKSLPGPLKQNACRLLSECLLQTGEQELDKHALGMDDFAESDSPSQRVSFVVDVVLNAKRKIKITIRPNQDG
jgi:hypothetical protein